MTRPSWHRSGGFAYPDGRMDLSNTQYAALALRAAARSGLEVSDNFWELLADRVIELQESFADDLDPAGFAYAAPHKVSASMTAAGVGVLAICKEQGVTDRRIEHSLSIGLAWLARGFTVTENRPRGLDYIYYYLYGLERVGALLGLERIGSHHWYAEGAAFLVEQQAADGRWFGQPQTAFALLFLTKATGPMTGARTLDERELAQGADADVRLRATGTSPVALWIDSFGPGARALEWEADSGRGPRVLRVEYRTRERGVNTILKTVAGDPSVPAGGQRFAVRHAFERAGTYSIHAVVHVLQPGFAVGDPAGELTLLSPPVRVRVPQAWNEELLGYADDSTRNLLAQAEVEVTASSSRGERSEPWRAVDDLQASCWRSLPEDAQPWLKLELARPVRANTLLLSHAFRPARGVARSSARFRRVALFVNGARKPIEVALMQDDWRKTVVPLKGTTRVKKLELRALDEQGAGGAGLAEVELQLRR